MSRKRKSGIVGTLALVALTGCDSFGPSRDSSFPDIVIPFSAIGDLFSDESKRDEEYRASVFEQDSYRRTVDAYEANGK